MRYEHQVTFLQRIVPQSFEGKTMSANITQMSPDQSVPIFGDAKQRFYVIRVKGSYPITSGLVQIDNQLNVEIKQAIQHRNSTVFYGVKYVGRL